MMKGGMMLSRIKLIPRWILLREMEIRSLACVQDVLTVYLETLFANS